MPRRGVGRHPVPPPVPRPRAVGQGAQAGHGCGLERGITVHDLGYVVGMCGFVVSSRRTMSPPLTDLSTHRVLQLSAPRTVTISPSHPTTTLPRGWSRTASRSCNVESAASGRIRRREQSDRSLTGRGIRPQVDVARHGGCLSECDCRPQQIRLRTLLARAT
jgi:hypothetical protein